MTLLIGLMPLFSLAQKNSPVVYNTPQAGNPIIPGYFADPTVRKFGDTYYIYATTDGNGAGFGPSQVWSSKDFVNWTLMSMNWPTTHWYWAPDAWEYNGSYYLLYCQPCTLHLGKGTTPRGPWHNVLGAEDAVFMPDQFVKNCITLDGQHFIDDDGKIYLYFGTWGIYPGFGCGVVQLDEHLSLTDNKRLIVNTEATEFFEAPFVIKQHGIYFLTYSAGSCHDDTYRVKYAISREGPMGPYESPENNCILKTNADGTIHGPGHHSILEENGKFYIIYHRHDNPHSTKGMHRQIAADEIKFNPDGTIDLIEGSHEGIGNLQPLTTEENIAFGKPVTASSYYNEDYKPEYAVDDNNGTLWRPKSCQEEWLQIDLESPKKISRIWIQFELPTNYYQYYVETSLDGKKWEMFSDKRHNTLSGSPLVEYGNAEARYVRLTFTGAEKRGISAALWNIKVFESSHTDPPQLLIGMTGNSFSGHQWLNHAGMLGQSFKTVTGEVSSTVKGGKSCVSMAPHSQLISQFSMPASFNNGGDWTLSYKIYGTESHALGNYVFWGQKPMLHIPPKKSLSTEEKWRQVAILCQGERATVYLDSIMIGNYKIKSDRKYAISASSNAVKSGEEGPRMILTSGDQVVQITDIRLYNWAQELAEIAFDATTPIPEMATTEIPAPQGLLVDIDASDYSAGSSVKEIANRAGQGMFQSEGDGIPVILKNNRAAFYFNGSGGLISDFSLPSNMADNAPYTISAWILNSETEEHETVVDLWPTGEDGEQGRITFGNGFNNDSGISFHNGSHENIGLNDYRGSELWHHWTICFDGHYERVYRDGEMIYEKNLKLRMLPNQYVSIGQSGNGDWKFKGYLGAVKIYDIPLSESQIKQEALVPPQNKYLFRLTMSDVSRGLWKNQGAWEGKALIETLAEEEGKIALKGAVTVEDINARHQVQGIVFTTQYPEGTTQKLRLISWRDWAIEATPSGFSIQGQEIPVKNPSAWNHIVLQAQENQEWAVWINGKKECSIHVSLPPNPTSLTIGEESGGTVIGEISIYGTCISDSEATAFYDNFQKNDLAQYHFKLEAQPITPDYVRLKVIDEQGKTLSPGPVLFQFIHGQETSRWDGTPEYLFKIEDKNPRHIETFSVAVKDLHGNMNNQIPSVTVSMSPNNFSLLQDNFDTDKDYHSDFETTLWDGLFGFQAEEITAKSQNGSLTLASKDRNFNASEKNYGPLLYKEVTGDFVVQIRVTDYTGFRDGQTVAYLEGGLMALSENERGMIQLVQLGVFPHYNQGNILTNIKEFDRIQFSNMFGKDANMYLQIEKSGDYFYLRTSPDGITWEEMPHSPVYRPDLSGKPLKVGPFQVTYTNGFGTVEFDDFKLWQRR